MGPKPSPIPDGVEALLVSACAELDAAQGVEVRFDAMPQQCWRARLRWLSPDRLIRGEWLGHAPAHPTPQFGLVRFSGPAQWEVQARLIATPPSRAFAARAFRVRRLG